MTWTDKARIALTKDEGWRQKPYDDKTGHTLTTLPSGGKVTIGIGWNLSDNGLPGGIIEQLFQLSLRTHTGEIVSVFGSPFFEGLSENRKVGLVSLSFNLGLGTFREFAKTITAVRAWDWTRAEEELRHSLWFEEVGDRAERVIVMICHDDFPYPMPKTTGAA